MCLFLLCFFHGGAVRSDDLSLLGYSGNRRQELGVVQDKVRALLGLGS